MAALAEIRRLWDRVISYGADVRNGDCDGLACWNALKCVLLRHSAAIEWSDDCLLFYKQLLATGVVEDYDVNIVDKLTWERHHFLLQHGRIPNRNPTEPTTVHLLQIGYNCGQMSADLKTSATSIYTVEQLYLYNTMKMNFVETYLKTPICFDALGVDEVLEEISCLSTSNR
jgi:hypothetical protein